MKGCKKVVLVVVKNVVAHSHARRYKLGDATLNQFLCQFRVFELVADGNAMSGAYQFWQICVESVMWKSCHLNNRSLAAVVTLCKGYASYVGSSNCVFAICFVKVAASEQQDCIGILVLQIHKLLHHRSHYHIFSCHYCIVFFV